MKFEITKANKFTKGIHKLTSLNNCGCYCYYCSDKTIPLTKIFTTNSIVYLLLVFKTSHKMN